MREVPLTLSEPARYELNQLWQQYAAVSEELANRILQRLHLKMLYLRRYPELGRLRPEFNMAGLRSIAVSPRVIFYSVSPDAVIIHHVIDGRQNLAAFFQNEY